MTKKNINPMAEVRKMKGFKRKSIVADIRIKLSQLCYKLGDWFDP